MTVDGGRMERIKEAGFGIVGGMVLAPFVIYNAVTESDPKPTVWQWIGVAIFAFAGIGYAGRT